MHKVKLLRFKSTDQGTIGIVFIDNEFQCYSMELPWRDNEKNWSCIPTGIYQCKWHISPRFGATYVLQNVADRLHVLFHSGNVAGDKKKGFVTDSQGCILLGNAIGIMSQSNQDAVLSSRTALKEFNNKIDKKSFELEIFYLKDTEIKSISYLEVIL